MGIYKMQIKLPVIMDSTSVSAYYLVVGLFLAVYLIYRRFTRVSISDVPGPKPESWLLGNYRQLLQGQVGEADSEWNSQYGDIIRIKAPFGADSLIITDPKALQHLYNHSPYNFDKQHVRQELLGLLTGRGLIWANGDTHRRQRKIVSPAFGAAEARSYVPLFLKGASRLTEKWKSLILNQSDSGSEKPSGVISIPKWMTRATLDVLGEAAFDYEFNALKDDTNVIAKRYQTIVTDTFKPQSSKTILIQNLLSYLPDRMLQWYFDYAPLTALRPAKELLKMATEVSKTLVETKKREAGMAFGGSGEKGKGKRDIFSLLVRANAGLNKDADAYLTDEEMWATMTTILSAGQETTSSTLTWGLQEIAKNPHIQDRLREEIKDMWREVIDRGDSEFTGVDLDKMKYMGAVIKEILRLYPVSYYNLREANKDEVIPLSKPLLLKSGKLVTEITVPKGVNIFTSLVVYNRNKELFGKDAHMFNPDRWLDSKLNQERKRANVGVGIYGDTMSFGSGARSCIGWRFALYELQSFLTELLTNFHFEPTPGLSQRLRKESCVFMVPKLEGELDKGAQMPLKLSLVNPEE